MKKGQIFSVRVSEKILHGPAGNMGVFLTLGAMEGRNLYTSSYLEVDDLQVEGACESDITCVLLSPIPKHVMKP